MVQLGFMLAAMFRVGGQLSSCGVAWMCANTAVYRVKVYSRVGEHFCGVFQQNSPHPHTIIPWDLSPLSCIPEVGAQSLNISHAMSVD